MTLGRYKTVALVDPGSMCSFLNDRAARACEQQGWRQLGNERIAILADGSESALGVQLSGRCQAMNRSIWAKFLVMPNLRQEVLLGVDILIKMGLKMYLDGVDITPVTSRPQTSVCSTEGPVTMNHLQPRQQDLAKQFLEQHMARFAEIKGPTPLVKHEIRLEDPTPLKQRYRPRNPATQEIIDEEVSKMMKEGIIQPSKSPWSSPVVIARKKDGKPRFCVDFRRVNKVTKKDAYPLPQVNATLDKLRGAKYLSTIDLKNGYWQVPLTEESKPITAFTVPGKGLFEFTVMPFGLHSAPSTFQRLLDKVITPDMAPHAFAYLDDIVICTGTFEGHVRVLHKVFKRLYDAKLRPNPDKCQFFRSNLKYLGHIVDERGLRPDSNRVAALTSLTPPRNMKEARRFLGLISWYRRFIKDVSQVAAPLHQLLKKNAKWEWTDGQQQAFDELKKRLTSAPILACPNWNKTFTLQTDASKEGLGVALTQQDGDEERIIAFASRSLTPAERNYSTTELECLAVKWGVWKMRDYLEGYHFVVLTDHLALKWLDNIDNPSGRLARWAMELSQWDFEVRYRKGTENLLADTLSRQPLQVCAAKSETEDWYQRRLQAVREDPNSYPDYVITDGQLYRHILHTLDFNEASAGEQWKICVPSSEQQRVLEEIHDQPTAGHLGIAKTLFRLSQKYYWPGMLRMGSQYVRNCPSCQKFKASQQISPGQMHATNVDHPWEIVTVDLIGPLPRSNSGNTWLLVMQDKCTKWVELTPLRKATGKAVTEALKRQICLRHGCPKSVLSDNGRQFISADFKDLLSRWHIQHRQTPPYTPQCNPVERTNRVIKTMIAQNIEKSQKTWDILLPELAFAYNTARHDSTSFTPAYLNFGRELKIPGSLDRQKSLPSRQGHQDRIKKLHEALELARSQLAQNFQKQSKHYNLRRRPWIPKKGEKVLKKSHFLSNKIDSFNAKLAQKYEGPFTVHSKISPVIFNLKDATGKIIPHIHVRDLKAFHAQSE